MTWHKWKQFRPIGDKVAGEVGEKKGISLELDTPLFK